VRHPPSRAGTVDPGVEVEAAFFGELDHDDCDEGLGDAADVLRHVGIDIPAARVETRAGGDLDDRAGVIANGNTRRSHHQRGATPRCC
jgi:hypothetical protein